MTATKTERECPVIKTTSKDVSLSPKTTTSDASNPLSVDKEASTGCTSIGTNTAPTCTPTPHAAVPPPHPGLDTASEVTEPSTACTAVDEVMDSGTDTPHTTHTNTLPPHTTHSSTNTSTGTTTSSTNTSLDSGVSPSVLDASPDVLDEEGDDSDDLEEGEGEELEEESDDDSDAALQREEGIEDMSKVEVPRLLEIEEKLKNNQDFKGAARITEYICYKLNKDPLATAGSKAETLLRCGDYMLRAIESSEDFLNPLSLDQASTTGVPDFLGFFVVALGVYDDLVIHDVEHEGLPSNLFYGPVLTNLNLDMLGFVEGLEFKRKGEEEEEGVKRFVKAFYDRKKANDIKALTTEEEKEDKKETEGADNKEDKKEDKEEVKEATPLDPDSPPHDPSTDAYDIEASSIPPTKHDIERLMYLYLRMGDGFQSIESHGQALLFYLRCFALVYISGIRDHRLLSPLISLAQELQWSGLHTLASRVLKGYIGLLKACAEDFLKEGSSVPEGVHTSIPQSLEDATLMLSETLKSLERCEVIPSRLSSERQKALFNAVGDVGDTEVGTKATFDVSTVPAEEVKEVRVKRKGEEGEREVKVAKKD